MALNGQMLGTQIANIIIDPAASPEMRDRITQSWIDIATAIVTHFQTMGQVQTTVTTTVTGAGAGANGGGPIATVVTGTGTGTGVGNIL